ncbi:MAG TPA: MBOAT family O-acyltransferase [Pyrinomonadaceae bacterium]|jgi:D-alanyl-lipoteichoic acid acyltransferase DltB (MBOAT superfamily)
MFETPLFWALLLVTAAAFHVTSRGQVRTRAAVLAVAGVIALVFVVRLNPVWVLFLVATSVWIVAGLRWTKPLAERRSYLASFLVFLPVLVPWALGKQAVALEWPPLSVLYFVGFSFYLIKAWTLIRDYHDGRIEHVDPFVALAYFLFFPAYVAGPMHFYSEFEETVRRPLALDGEALVDVVFRVLLGFVKIKLIAALFLPVSLEAVRESGVVSVRRFTVGSFAYSAVIWADFSGYSDLAIATSRLAGIHTPENFNYPYAAANIREFWQRWHVTFSRVLMSYVFVPVSRKLQAATGRRGRAILIASSLLTFLFCGYWHGPTLNFLLWGLYHGFGIVAYDLYRRGANRRRLKRAGKPLFPYAGPLGRAASVLLTFSFVSLGWIFFALPTGMIFRQ